MAPLQIIMVIFLFWQFIQYIVFIPIGNALFLLLIQPLFCRFYVHLRFALVLYFESVKIEHLLRFVARKS